MSFELRVEEKLDQLAKDITDLRVDVKGVSTKMNFIVGPDGTNGLLKDYGDRITVVEKRQAYIAGATGVVGVGLGAALHLLKVRLFGGGH